MVQVRKFLRLGPWGAVRTEVDVLSRLVEKTLGAVGQPVPARAWDRVLTLCKRCEARSSGIRPAVILAEYLDAAHDYGLACLVIVTADGQGTMVQTAVPMPYTATQQKAERWALYILGNGHTV